MPDASRLVVTESCRRLAAVALGRILKSAGRGNWPNWHQIRAKIYVGGAAIRHWQMLASFDVVQRHVATEKSRKVYLWGDFSLHG